MTALQKYSDNKIATAEYFGNTIIDAFVASRHGSPNTSKTYRNSLNQLQKFFAANSITAPTTADVDAYINELRAAKKSPYTIRLYSTVTKLYFAYLAKQDIYRDVAADMTPLKLRKSKTHNKKSLTDEQAKALLSAVKGNDVISLRNKAIIALALCTGLRTCEISRANVEDFQQDAGYWTLAVQGKGRIQKDEIVKVAEPVVELILAYLDKRGEVDNDAPLFASTSHNIAWEKNSFGNRLSEQSVGKMIKAAMKRVGINDKKITAHSTRHYAATCAIRNGIDIREIGAMLRHSSIVVTSVYLHDLSVETRRAELSVANTLFSGAA